MAKPYNQVLIDILDAPHGDLYDKNTVLEKAVDTMTASQYETVKSAFKDVEPFLKSNIHPLKELYICDPKKNTECPKTSCYWNGGLCMQTTRKEFSLEGELPAEERY